MYEGFYDAPNPAGKLKHAILRRYLLAWLSILSRGATGGRVPTLHYVDTHAGRGRYEDGSLGSPLLALGAAKDVLETNQVPFEFVAHFIELEESHVAALKAELPRLLADVHAIRADVQQGDSHERLPTLLEAIPAGAATIVFVDPFGYKDHVSARRVLTVLRGRPRTEVFLTFMSSFMSRFATDKTKHKILDEILGTTDWRRFLGKKDIERRMVDLYSRVLVADHDLITGNAAALLAFPIELHPGGRQSPYSLVHVSQNPKARFEMEKAVDRIDGFNAVPLFAAPHVVDTLDETLRMTGQQRRDILDVARSAWREYPFARWSDIRAALKQLHGDGVVEIWMKTGNPRRQGTLPVGDDRVAHTGRRQSTQGLGL